MPLVTGRKPSQHPDPAVPIDQNAYLVIETSDGIVCKINFDTGGMVTNQNYTVDGNTINQNSSMDTLLTAIINAINSGGGGGGGLLEYQAARHSDVADNDGCFVTASASGITYERVGGSGTNTEGVLRVPSGALLRGVVVHFAAGQAPGNTFYLNVDFQETGKSVNGSVDSVKPALATVSSKPASFTDAAPALNFVHAGTPIQIGVAQVDDNGTRTRVRFKVQNYNQQVGSNASILVVLFP